MRPDELAEIENVTVAFPRLPASGAAKTSQIDRRYNCIAWAAGETRRKWWPAAGKEAYWPPNVAGKQTIDAFVAAFGTRKYHRCGDGTLEPGMEKIAIYVDQQNRPLHAARQLVNGRWTSKLGEGIDIEHDPGDLEGPAYGTVAVFMRRPVPAGKLAVVPTARPGMETGEKPPEAATGAVERPIVG